MATTSIARDAQSDGTTVLRAGACTFTYRRPRAGVLEIVIEGVDASAASMPPVSVATEWTRFIALNQKDLKRVSVLVSSKSVQLTMAIAQHLSQTGRLMQRT